MQTYHALQETGTIAILRGWSCIQAMPLVQALYAGGIRMAEVAVDNLDAFETVAKLRKIWDGKMYIGAGTITDEDRCACALKAGAQFIIAPNSHSGVVSLCQKNGIMVLPSVLTPSEIQAALAQGCEYVKLFPAGRMGPGYIRDILSPFPKAKIVAVGGISADNAPQYYAAGAVGVGVGGSLSALVDAGDWESITQQAQRLVRAFRDRSDKR